MSRRFNAVLIAFAALIGAGSLTACNTVKGAGQDVQAVGETVEDTASDLNDGNPTTP